MNRSIIHARVYKTFSENNHGLNAARFDFNAKFLNKTGKYWCKHNASRVLRCLIDSNRL